MMDDEMYNIGADRAGEEQSKENIYTYCVVVEPAQVATRCERDTHAHTHTLRPTKLFASFEDLTATMSTSYPVHTYTIHLHPGAASHAATTPTVRGGSLV